MYQETDNSHRYPYRYCLHLILQYTFTSKFTQFSNHFNVNFVIGSSDLSESEVYDITLKCLQRSQHLPRKGIHYETPSNYEPFAVNMGQMTVYRFTIRCKVRTCE